MPGVVYLHRSKTENLVYIGQTMHFEERWDQHVLAAFLGSTTCFHQAIRRLGPSDFSCKILDFALNREELNGLEKRYIADYRAQDRDHGYNHRVGGGSSATTPEEAILPRRLTLSGHEKFVEILQRPIPLYNCYGELIGKMHLKDALQMHGTFLQLRARGNGNRRRFVSAKLYARKTLKWAVRPSDGFSVLQLIRE